MNSTPIPTAGIVVERLAPAARAEAGRVLAEALLDEPGFTHIIPGPAQRRVAMHALLGALVRDAQPFGNVWVAQSGGEIVGTAVWYAPGDFPAGPLRQLRMAPALIPLFRFGFRLVQGLGSMESAAKSYFPDERCWYLAALGVAPGQQGRGIGSHLMRTALAEIDALGDAAYLETGEAHNVGFYERAGFVVREPAAQITPSPGPTHWTMWRPGVGA